MTTCSFNPILKGKFKMKKLTHVAIITDCSGSMACTRSQSVQGFNEQVQQIKSNVEDGEQYLVSLISFNGNVYEHFWKRDVTELQETSEEGYICSGSTAMRDGVGYTINKYLEEVDQEPKDAEIAYLMIIISDGYENASQHISPGALKELIESCKSKGNWTFTYMGCSPDYVEQLSQEMAIPKGNMAAWDNSTSKGAAFGYSNVTRSTDKYLKARKLGTMGLADFYSCSSESIADFSNVDDADNDANSTPQLFNAVDIQSTNEQKDSISSPKANYFQKTGCVDLNKAKWNNKGA